MDERSATSISIFELPLNLLQLAANLARFDFVAADDDDLSAHLQQFERRLLADAIGRAGDEYAFAFHELCPNSPSR